MMKKLLSMIMALCLAVGLAAPSMAAGEDELTAVTEKVKDALQIDDDYTDFSGSYQDGVVPSWYLSWSDENRSLSVTCTEEGVVLDAYRYDYNDESTNFYGFDAAFPALSQDEAEQQAQDWLSRLMGENEAGRVDEVSISLNGNNYYWFSGVVLMNGLESPVSFRMSISENGLMSYYRSDEYVGYVGELPSAEASVTAQDGADGLMGAVKMELYYVSDGEGGARLMYVPSGATTVVDAQSGEVVDMDALYASITGYYSTGTMTLAAAGDAETAMSVNGTRLTQVELDSIANYSDALDEKTLDQSLRAVDALGLNDSFTLQNCSYAMDSETGDITATLRYTASVTESELYGYTEASYRQYASWGDELTLYKYISVNAKTGALISVDTSYPLWERDDSAALSEETLGATADEFLKDNAADMYGQSALNTLRDNNGDSGYTYAQTEQGYFYPENYLYVSLNPVTGTVDSYYYGWDDSVVFADAEGIVDDTAASSAYTDALSVTLGYVAWPEGLNYDDPIYAAYIDWGYTYVESLRLAWYYDGLNEISGVDALTGEAVSNTAPTAGTYEYSDLSGVSQRTMIEALAEAGIGFSGGIFKPAQTLTQRDALCLLFQAGGSNPEDWDDSYIRQEAIWLGFIADSEWAPDAEVTRMDFIRMVIGASAYGEAAELTGVWNADFSDVNESEVGYAAIAQALGMVGGDPLSPDKACTRAAAAVMLYYFMSR